MDWPAGTDRVILECVDSTMAEATRRARSQGVSTGVGCDRAAESQRPPGPVPPAGAGAVWILARRQSAGRGRRGREWRHPAGNFAATLLLRPRGGAGQAALRSFAMALALFDAFETVIGSAAGLALKWPNDVMLSGGKVAGILLETQGRRGEMLAIGVGVNLIAAPPHEAVEAGAVRPVSLLGETGVRVSPERLLDALAPAFDGWERRLRAYGFGPLRAAWLARAARLGEPIVARLPHETVYGIFETVDETGAIVLKTADGRRSIAAAEIFF